MNTELDYILRTYEWEDIVQKMDDEIRESLHEELAPCSEKKFLRNYAIRHREKFFEDLDRNIFG